MIPEKPSLLRLISILVLAWSGVSAHAAGSDADLDELKALGNVEAAPTAREDTAVTSVGRKIQRASESAAAIYVITQEDIRRSGVTSIPEALRLAPGVQVARVDSNKWAVSARGFNGVFANKLLVLMDGREIYNPGFGGVYWDAQDYPLDDIERIEVIRGPGASLWGANAVNGVISIITKGARETLGGSLTAGGGNYEQGFGAFRYGAQLSENTHGRIYAKGFRRGRFLGNRSDGYDDWATARAGFRVDHDGAVGDRVTLLGNAFSGELNQQNVFPGDAPEYNSVRRGTARTSGFNLLGRWSRVLSLTSEFSLQGYYDHSYRSELSAGQERDILDLELQHRFLFGTRHDVTWGLGYRMVKDRLSASEFLAFDPVRTNLQLFSAFLQDDFALIPQDLTLTVGAKLQHNDFTGFEGQPTIRLLWAPNRHHTVWTAVSRAVRTPTRVDCCLEGRVFTVPPSATGPTASPFPVEVGLLREPRFQAEPVWAYELGYRFQSGGGLSADLALFYNRYDRLRSLNLNQAAVSVDDGVVRAGFRPLNDMAADTYGVELKVDWKPLDFWTLQLAYDYLQLDFQAPPGTISSDIGTSPTHQGYLRSGLDLGSDVDVDFWLRYVDALSLAGTLYPFNRGGIPAYMTLDARLAWRPAPGLELSLVGQNLLDPQHPEFVQESVGSPRVEVPRSFYLQFNLKF